SGLVRGVAAAVAVLPVTAVRVCGTALGRAAFALDRFHRRIAMDNLAHAFPGRPARERRAITRAVFVHFGRLLLELMKFGAIPPDAMLALVESEGEERVRQAYARGRGVLFFTGHFGYWEMQAIAQPLQVKPVSVLARPLDNPLLHGLLERIRARTG